MLYVIKLSIQHTLPGELISFNFLAASAIVLSAVSTPLVGVSDLLLDDVLEPLPAFLPFFF
jgi:hypothetical protein